LKFLASGTKPRTNKDAMNEVLNDLKDEGLFYGDKVRVAKPADADSGSESEEVERKRDKKKTEKKEKKDKKDKKDKKEKKSKRSKSIDSIEEAKPKKRARV